MSVADAGPLQGICLPDIAPSTEEVPWDYKVRSVSSPDYGCDSHNDSRKFGVASSATHCLSYSEISIPIAMPCAGSISAWLPTGSRSPPPPARSGRRGRCGRGWRMRCRVCRAAMCGGATSVSSAASGERWLGLGAFDHDGRGVWTPRPPRHTPPSRASSFRTRRWCTPPHRLGVEGVCWGRGVWKGESLRDGLVWGAKAKSGGGYREWQGWGGGGRRSARREGGGRGRGRGGSWMVAA